MFHEFLILLVIPTRRPENSKNLTLKHNFIFILEHYLVAPIYLKTRVFSTMIQPQYWRLLRIHLHISHMSCVIAECRAVDILQRLSQPMKRALCATHSTSSYDKRHTQPHHYHYDETRVSIPSRNISPPF